MPSNEPLLLGDERVDRDVERRSTADHAGDEEAQPKEPAGAREEGLDDAIADIARVDDARRRAPR